ncbi:hypothetical protein CHGG_09524 [Chaetomium globosum CBS 148.51]|uniref:Uncharacterized protein n=1 Tax=Chaetomium globosum (strain ATCC 6205 / CBS 148.51 / DSM 1962 / NBRC 6347 / NRRL 1970) TaxID=306901 RepID=Q2GR80_CHAGB|nr:uncharacterized protein CHGG_09524 [Chaetomium globosum CBS 148.51]EAQ85510.1 hypothetical protein CHGG_09524 [Chaetomium globosum CBS 148.51]
MAANAEDLFIRPLRDVVAAGNAAVTNATTRAPPQSPGSADHVDPMSRAAQALLREGERALNKVQLVWRDQVSRYGDGFREVMVQQASIENRRLHLEDLLWDFDDFTQPDEFDQARYAALQAATKAFALDVVETAKRLKLETAAPAIPPGGFPPLPPLPTRPETRSVPSSRPPSTRSTRARAQSKAGAAHDEGDDVNGENSESVPQSPRPSTRSSSGPVYRRDSVEANVRAATANHHARSQSAAAHGPYQSHDAFTPPASPSIGPVPRPQDLTLNTSGRPRTFDSAPSPSTTHTRTSVMSNTSSSSSALLGSLDSLVIAEDSSELDWPISREAEVTMTNTRSSVNGGVEEPGLIGLDALLKESAYNSDRRKSRPASPRIPDCAISQDSTYYKLRGLCKGATKFRKDGNWDSIKLINEDEYGSAAAGPGDMMRASDGITVPFQYETAKVGACGDCGYAHDLDEVELDMSDSRKNIPTTGIIPSLLAANHPLQPKQCVPNLAPVTASGSSLNLTFGKGTVQKPCTPASGVSKQALPAGKETQLYSGRRKTSCATSDATPNHFPRYPAFHLWRAHVSWESSFRRNGEGSTVWGGMTASLGRSPRRPSNCGSPRRPRFRSAGRTA